MAQQPPQTVIPPDMMQPPPPSMHAVNSYYPDSSTDITGGLPMNLDSLRDGPPGTKPFYPYSTLIRYAIKGAPNQKLLLEDIYYAIESRFPYFRTAPPGWKNSVRHNLSLNPCFEKVPRPLTDRGKGSYWTVNDNVDPRTGVHRVRKKKNKGGSGKGRASRLEEDIDYHPPTEEQPFDPNFVPPSIRPVEEGPSAQPPVYPPPHYPYVLSAIRFPPPPLFPPDEQFELDERGNVNWHAAWLKELAQLQHMTEEQQKAGADQEWYRMMLFRVRSAMMAPPMNPGEPVPGAPPHPMQGQPPNPVDVPREP
ncbi:uncharacterized protein LAESUDRAFT_639845 [Laetiporus sulphureus 93-53]|uniref:Fork-head domain-containing protein n=1 Tax=Laetiporus sulphureus 93-53 TaxID=1314785 RepID=A0A165I3L7_9APHY|nr:uncharacterized protein LAESUDRAFT_639845 [Laetiporus sulphureus 93-53]KZT12551.1 hypothetical protein LAESUDRAFT_639845 [Laetiporus sulphureus 93-53]